MCGQSCTKKAIHPFYWCDEETFLGRKNVAAISLQKLQQVVLLIDKTTVSEFIQSLTENLYIGLVSIDNRSVLEWGIS